MISDSSSIASALVATASVAIASVLVFHPSIRAVVAPSTAVLAPTWAIIIAEVHAGTVFYDGVRSIIGSLLGSSLGLAAYILSGLILDQVDEYRHIVATVITIPFAFLISLADPIVNSPLNFWLRTDSAFLSLYIVASFSRHNGHSACLNTVIAFSFGSLSAIVTAGIVRLATDFGSTKRNLRDCFFHFTAAQTHWLEGLTGFMTCCLGEHATELDLRQEKASASLSRFQHALSLARSGDPWSVLKFPETASEMTVTAVLMHSQLLAFRATIAQESYRSDTLKTTLFPVADLFNNLRMSVVLALRPNTPDRVKTRARLAIQKETGELFTSFIQHAANTATNRGSDLPQGAEVVRLHFAVVSLIRFSLLADKFLQLKDSAVTLHGPITSLKLFFIRNVKILISANSWKKYTRNIRHACRSVIAQQIGAQIALLIARLSPHDFGPYVFWAQLPIVFCFLPTFGGSLIKGSRRVLGTLAGGALACITAVANTGSPSSFWLEMIFITFLGKFLSFHPSIGYAGSVFAFTWYILMLPGIKETDESLLLTAAFYRMILTVGGVCATYIFGAVLFPSFSSMEMRNIMSKAVSACSSLAGEGIAAVVNGQPFAENPGNSVFEGFKGAGDKALKSLHKYVNPLPQLCREASAEIGFFKSFGSHKVPSPKTLIRCEDVLYRFLDSVCVFSATAAATRISEYSHTLFFTEHVTRALSQLSEKADLAGAKLASNLHALSYSMDECYLGDCLDDVDGNLMAVRNMLGSSKKLPSAVKGGSPLLYVFHFALCEMVDRWDDLVRAIDGKADDTFAKKPERFRRISSSLSSLSIL